MKYVLRLFVLGNVPELEITEKKYLAYEHARKVLINSLAIEEKYEILITNYLDFERKILDLAASFMVSHSLDYDQSFVIRMKLNVCLVNLLTSARLYLDQLVINVRECIPELDNTKQLIKEIRSKEYDKNSYYRFMEELRNYTQHYGTPIHHVKIIPNQTQNSDSQKSLVGYTIELYSKRSYLEEDSKSKKRILGNIEEDINLKNATREYMDSISDIHRSVRLLIKGSTDASRKLIEDAHKEYLTIYTKHKNLDSLSACIKLDQKLEDRIPLLLKWDDVRIKLQNKNKKLIPFANRFVTGQVSS